MGKGVKGSWPNRAGIPVGRKSDIKEEGKMKVERLDEYSVMADEVTGKVEIIKDPKELNLIYRLTIPKIEEATQAFLDVIKSELLKEISIKPQEVLDPTVIKELKEKFYKKAFELIQKNIPKLSEYEKKFLAGRLVQRMLGLGDIEVLLSDDFLEEICVNSSKEPLWVYHKKFGWLKTNVFIPSEAEIQNFASLVGRRVGRQITTLTPLLDAYLVTGDRVNATLYPISVFGNTLTIRKFARRPWAITDYIEMRTISQGVAALLWLAIQYEMNLLIAGGTASGKTTMMNILASFIPQNQRVISIEETREIKLPRYLQWIPLLTREPNPEGKGGVSMLDLMINALRMRPDRVIVGEIRRAREAEVLFEAMHTGHAVLSTIHAETSDQVYRRLTNPPINLPDIMLEALQLILVMFRERRSGIRRVFELGELVPAAREAGRFGIKINTLFRWRSVKDEIIKENDSVRVLEELKLFTGMTENELRQDLKEREKILGWMIKNKIRSLDSVGRVVVEFYARPEDLLHGIEKNKSPQEIFGEVMS
ncbi:MAG: ATPase, T2SS/T4P/T4SS family [Candidatus Aenigmarchaeota archaeon]|nr:ATPase, T2SS/T4P/T4SS family [Candidatus Aenigmarchaeota archaeon]